MYFNAGDVQDLRRQIDRLFSDDLLRTTITIGAYKKMMERFTDHAYSNSLLLISRELSKNSEDYSDVYGRTN